MVWDGEKRIVAQLYFRAWLPEGFLKPQQLTLSSTVLLNKTGHLIDKFGSSETKTREKYHSEQSAAISFYTCTRDTTSIHRIIAYVNQGL